MSGIDVVIFHHAASPRDASLAVSLADARDRLISHQQGLLARAGATRISVVPGREDADGPETLGDRLRRRVVDERVRRLIVFGSGAVPLLSLADARRLMAVAASPGRVALTNNRYSSDICAVSDARALAELPALPSDNALPRWLEERAGFTVTDLPGRDRLAIDLDTPQDVALLALMPRAPREVVGVAVEAGLEIPRRTELRALAADPRRELLVFGRSGSRTLQWLERNVRCRVRFLAEERGLRASSPLAIAKATVPTPSAARPPRASIGRLLADRGPGALAEIVLELADGAIIDSRVLMADRFGPDEEAWPSRADRYASDLFRADDVTDPWLRDLTVSARDAVIPILLGAHTLVGPGIPIMLGASGRLSR